MQYEHQDHKALTGDARPRFLIESSRETVGCKLKNKALSCLRSGKSFELRVFWLNIFLKFVFERLSMLGVSTQSNERNAQHKEAFSTALNAV